MTPEARLQRLVPWNPTAGRGVLVWTFLSAVALGFCWYRAAGEGVLDDQMIWLALAVLVVVAEMYVLAGLVFSGRRALGMRRLRMVPDTLLEATAQALSASRHVHPALEDPAVFVVAGSSRFHREGCAMTAGREVQALASHEAMSTDLRPCGVCAEAPTAQAAVR